MTWLPANSRTKTLLDVPDWPVGDQTRQFLSLLGAVVGANLVLALSQLASPHGWILVLADLPAVALVVRLWIEVGREPDRHATWPVKLAICAGLTISSLLSHLFLAKEFAQVTVLVVVVISLGHWKTLKRQMREWRRAAEDSRRRVRDELRSKNQAGERRRLAVEASGSGYWYWDLQADQIHFSPSWATMLGHEAKELGADPEAWFGRVHPHYLPDLKEALSAHLYGRTERFQAQYRIQRRDGTYLWVLNRGVDQELRVCEESRRPAGGARLRAVLRRHLRRL